MTVPTDPFPNFVNGTTVADGDQVDARFKALYDMFDPAQVGIGDDNLRAGAGVQADKLASALLDRVGVSAGATVRRGKAIVATEETRTNTAYGLMATADRVSGVSLPTDGLIVVGYNALWKESVSGASRAALFVGANQLKSVRGGGFTTPDVVAAKNPGGVTNIYSPLLSAPAGLACKTPSADHVAPVTTGQTVAATNNDWLTEFIEGGSTLGGTPGLCHIFAAAGSYDISVQFKASSGSVTVKDRRLWVWTIGF